MLSLGHSVSAVRRLSPDTRIVLPTAPVFSEGNFSLGFPTVTYIFVSPYILHVSPIVTSFVPRITFGEAFISEYVKLYGYLDSGLFHYYKYSMHQYTVLRYMYKKNVFTDS